MAKESDFSDVGEGWVGPLPEICTLEEVAQFFRETPLTIRRQINQREKTGDFKRAFKKGGRWKVPRQDVEDYVQKMFGHNKGES